jgi:hypothetical protein
VNTNHFDINNNSRPVNEYTGTEISHTQRFKKLITNLANTNPKHPLILLSLTTPEAMKDVLQDEVNELYKQMNRYNLGMSDRGELVDLETGKLVHTNHLMCLLKKDHKSDLFNTSKLYEWLVVAAIEGYQLAVRSPNLPESEKRHFEVVNEYL